MVGGGTKDRLLSQMTANSCNCSVEAGPIEATVLGNVAIQLMSSGDIGSIEEARNLIAESQDILHYAPEDVEKWEKAYSVFSKYVQEP